MRGGHGRAERPTQRGGGGGTDSMVPARKCFFLLLALMTFAASPSPVAGKFPGRPVVWCRTVDMLTLTCWWQPVKGDDPSTNYTLFYTTQSGSTLANESAECPDYVTAGPNSCFFDQEHTSMWVMHCVRVVASSPTANTSFEKHCIKLLDYVEPDVPPVNVNVTLRNVSDPDPVVLVTWAPPPSANVKYGLVVLEYEVEYRAEHQTSGTVRDGRAHM
uniref:Truncated growth hormone receptor/prolactin receptor n=1 Tax=Petromyzon marinus TaxID=7757 RepID=R9UBH2_PETMA|nr:truncated growth hormone receptor/prolactin receptor [Petromyzon marinus]